MWIHFFFSGLLVLQDWLTFFNDIIRDETNL